MREIINTTIENNENEPTKLKVQYLENGINKTEEFLIYCNRGMIAIHWKKQLIHVQKITIISCLRGSIKYTTSKCGNELVDKISEVLGTVKGMSKEEFSIYALQMLDFYHEIKRKTGGYAIGYDVDEWSKNVFIELTTPYANYEIGSIIGSGSSVYTTEVFTDTCNDLGITIDVE